jgi:hypothetical protein
MFSFFVISNCQKSGHILADIVTYKNKSLCYSDLFHKQSAIREKAHTDIFGKKNSAFDFLGEQDNAVQYLSRVLAAPPAVDNFGILLDYDALLRYDFFDFVFQRIQSGRYGLIHLVRHPLVCYVLEQQEKQKNRYIFVDIPDFLEYWYAFQLAEPKLKSLSLNSFHCCYSDLLYRPQYVVRELYEFFEIEPEVRLRPMGLDLAFFSSDFILNWNELKACSKLDFLLKEKLL